MNEVPMLTVKGVSKAFPGVQALDKVNFEAFAGQVTALLGENGAGKSTLMKILSGVYKADEGDISLNGVKIQPQNPHQAQDLGISIIYQEFNLTPNQNVFTNIFLGREPMIKGLLGKLGFVDSVHMRQYSNKLLSQVGARFSNDRLVNNLSVAEQQMVEIAKALSVKSKVIIMDEPTSALGKEEVKVLFDIIQDLKSQGLAIIFITHRLEEVFEIADRAIVFRDGRWAGEVKVAEATAEQIIGLMVGRALDRSQVHEHVMATQDVVLKVQNLNRKGVLHDINFELHRGEILGLAGLVGAGRTETARALFGADRIDKGEIFINGKQVEIVSPDSAVKAGLALVPEGRQTQGLVLIQTVERNIALPNLDMLSHNAIVNQGKMRQVVQNYVTALNIRTPSLEQRVLNLSGGNQQKVVLAKWLASNPKVLILDEPTRGIDVGAKAEVYEIMNELVQQGIGVIMISSEMPEILAISDRILVMYEGRIMGELTRANATQERIMTLASGKVLEAI
ncbi:MAG: sugar ABC transporter ATP-binding protein [Anaerolineales bacterium]|nr:sugar ABC transporter ATP-binding protein [Anaerolineales bacterium]